ncbi:glycoside hydrolase family 16 protein [Mycena pura]|uniref:Glycoside hydrolase family 16 protein n=1 Tax=Mycena pura TaxID=153505 RepID=A0AAD6YIT9_9AGAR|nr:glycoside hydrolase family 16 protein [Mycena pura]
MATNPFDTPPLSRVHTTDAPAPAERPKRMPSTALPPAAPYQAVAKPWTTKSNPRARISYFMTWCLLFVGAGLGGIQAYFSYRNVRIDRAPLCLVFEDNFNEGDDAAVFGTATTPGRWLREVQMGGFGNGEFEMTTGSSNNSFLQNGHLYIVPTLTPDAPYPDGTTYNSTDCTFNITAPNGGFSVPPKPGSPPGTPNSFDWDGYYSACSRTSNSSDGTIINPVQSARLTTFISAQSGSEATLSSGKLRYGRIEVRAKMPVGDWLWPAIWMLPVDSVYGAWPRSGEIDIVESRGNGLEYTNRGANFVQGALNWGPSVALNSVGKSFSYWGEKRKLFSSDFHTYAVEWTDKWIRVSVDTRLHTLLDLQFNEPFFQRGDYPATVTGADGHPEAVQNPWTNATNADAAPFDQDFFLIMNVAVGGTNGWFPDGQGNKPWVNNAGSTSPVFPRLCTCTRADDARARLDPMKDFINGKSQWLPTWPEDLEQRAMVVDYVRMWKHCGDPQPDNQTDRQTDRQTLRLVASIPFAFRVP